MAQANMQRLAGHYQLPCPSMEELRPYLPDGFYGPCDPPGAVVAFVGWQQAVLEQARYEWYEDQLGLSTALEKAGQALQLNAAETHLSDLQGHSAVPPSAFATAEEIGPKRRQRLKQQLLATAAETQETLEIGDLSRARRASWS